VFNGSFNKKLVKKYISYCQKVYSNQIMDSSLTLMDLVEPILSEHYNGCIGSLDISTLRNSGTGYLYASLNDDFTIVRSMYNEKCVGYIIQIYEYSTGTQRRSALLFSYRSDKLGFNFDGPKEFYYNCYIDSSSVPEVIKNFKQLITTGSVDITNTSWDWDPVRNTGEQNTNKFELYLPIILT